MKKVIADKNQFNSLLFKVAAQVAASPVYQSNPFYLLGIPKKGVLLTKFLEEIFRKNFQNLDFEVGELDVTFYRDDFQTHILSPNPSTMDFNVQDANILLVDDVLFTGRTLKAALDTLFSYGRPKRVDLLVMVDRTGMREIPVASTFNSLSIETLFDDKITLDFYSENSPQILLEQF